MFENVGIKTPDEELRDDAQVLMLQLEGILRESKETEQLLKELLITLQGKKYQ